MITVEDIAYIRLSAPDLDLMEAFLMDFGMVVTEKTDSALYMRGHGPDPVLHVTEKGEPRHIGFALKVESRADLEKVAREFNVPVEPRTEPGGGAVAKLKDPDGNLIEIVHDIAPAARPSLREPLRYNPAGGATRHNSTIRMQHQPSHVMRLGHAAIHAINFESMLAFYRDHLGMKMSDSYYAGSPNNTMAAFLHCGLGERFTDHHTVALIGVPAPGFDHVGYEVLDLDDLMMGNRYLKKLDRWEHSWGVGRHIDGSQIFDYWRDPYGLKIEHWTDGDQVNDNYEQHQHAFSIEAAGELLAQWGPPFNPDFLR